MNISNVSKVESLIIRISQFRALSTQAIPKLSSNNEEWKNAKSFNQIPKLSAFHFIRRMMPGGKFSGFSFIDIYRELNKEMGDITVLPGMFGRSRIVVAFNPEDFETVFRNEGIYPIRNALQTIAYYQHTVRPDVYGDFGSVATENREKWHKTRSLVNPIMMKPQTTKLYVPKIDEISQEFVEVMRKVRDDKLETPANFSDLLNQWSLESITCITLDRRLGLMKESNKDPNAVKLIKLIRQFMVASYEFEINPSIWKYYQTKAFKKYMQVLDQMIEILLSYVEDAIKNLEKQPPKDEQDQSVLEKLLKIDKKLAVVMCSDAVGAGVDTTSSALLTTLYCLAKNPEKQEKLRKEVMKILLNKKDPLTVENMKNLPYLRAVIKEGLRLYNPTLGTVRTIETDIVLAGYQIPKGEQVQFASLNASHSEKNFKLAKEFIPERWLRDNVDAACPHAKDAHPFSYMPFGFGARMCVGRRFAELELETLLMRIIRNFKVEWHHPDMKIKGVLVNIPEGDMKFKLIDVVD